MKKSHLSLIIFTCVAMLSLCAQEKKAENPWKDAEKLFPGIKLIKLEKTEPRPSQHRNQRNGARTCRRRTQRI